MFCNKCGQELAEGSLFCNKCGAKLSESIDVNEEENNENNLAIIKKRWYKNKKVIIGLGILLIFLIITGGLLIQKSNHDKQVKKDTQIKEAQIKATHDGYELNFAKTTYDILAETYSSEIMCNQISTTWKNAISSSSKDFNVEIEKLYEKWKSEGTTREREEAKDKIEKSMIQLHNPPKDYEDVYKLFVDLYSKYGQIYSQATSPKGSLVTYNQDVNQKGSEFQATYDKIKVIKPDIEIKGKKE